MVSRRRLCRERHSRQWALVDRFAIFFFAIWMTSENIPGERSKCMKHLFLLSLRPRDRIYRVFHKYFALPWISTTRMREFSLLFRSRGTRSAKLAAFSTSTFRSYFEDKRVATSLTSFVFEFQAADKSGTRVRTAESRWSSKMSKKRR